MAQQKAKSSSIPTQHRRSLTTSSRKMILNLLRAFSLIFFLCPHFLPISTAFNISAIFFSSNAVNTAPPPLPLPPYHFLKDVLKAIVLKRSWKLEDIRVTKLRNFRIGSSQRYEFRIRMGKNDLLFRFSEEANSWRRIRKKGKFGNLSREISSNKVLNKFELHGPFELWVEGDEELKLTLPMNITHSGLKQMIVDEGITLSIQGIQEISLFRPRLHKNKNQYYYPPIQSSCTALPLIHIPGPASLSSKTHIKTRYLSQNTLKLSKQKCHKPIPIQSCPITSLAPKLDILERVLKKFPRGKLGSLKAKMTKMTLVRFDLELEREIQEDDEFWGTIAEWRTKPVVEKVKFEVVARVEEGRFIPMVVKKVRLFVAAESTPWSTLMSNISFTKFASSLVSPEALTLDVKW